MGDLSGTLDEALIQRVRAHSGARNGNDLIDFAMAAATASPADRGWRLVELGAQLRRAGDFDRALVALDAVVGVSPEWEARAAAYTVAAAIHCDRGDLDKARALCEQTLAEGVDEHLLKVSARVYWELYRASKLPEFKQRWEDCSRQLDALAAA